MCNFHVHNWENANIYKRFKCLKNFKMKFLCIYLDERGGVALMHVYIWEYGNSHSQPLLQNCLKDVYGNLVGMKFSWPKLVLRLFIRSTLGQGKNESKRASKTKGFTWNAAILVVVSARYSKSGSRAGQK